MQSLFALHDGCNSSSCIDLGVASPSEPPATPIGTALASMLTSGALASLAGYPDPQGEGATRDAIRHLYESIGCAVDPDAMVVTNGAHSEIVLWVDKVFQGLTIGVQHPRYPAIEAQAGSNSRRRVAYDPTTRELELPNRGEVDVLYLCNPHNPTGTVMQASYLQSLVDWCVDTDVILFYDNVYATFQGCAPFFSIYEMDGAGLCAVEINSLSKTANFAGLRFGWTTMLPGLNSCSLRDRRISLAFSDAAGVSKLDQMAGRIAITPALMERQKVGVRGYLENARILREACARLGLRVVGGVEMPMLWIQIPQGDAVSFVNRMHAELEIFVSAGPIFGEGFDEWIRMSAFCSEPQAREAAVRIASWKL